MVSIGQRLKITFQNRGCSKRFLSHGICEKQLESGRLVCLLSSGVKVLLPPVANCKLKILTIKALPLNTSTRSGERQRLLRYRRAVSKIALSSVEFALPHLQNVRRVSRTGPWQSALGKNSFGFATLNCRTLSDATSLEALVTQAFCLGIDVLCVQETRLPEQQTQLNPDGWLFISVACSMSGQAGVGFILSPRCAKELVSFKTLVDHRVLYLRLRGLHAICVYNFTSQNGLFQEIVYSKLSSTLSELRDSLPIIIGGDFNADICRSSSSSFGTRAAELFQDFIDANNLMPHSVRTSVIKPTWNTSHSNGGHTLDYVLVRRRFASSIQNSRVIAPYISSDHRLVKCTIRTRWRKTSPPVKSPPVHLDFSDRNVIAAIDIALAEINARASLSQFVVPDTSSLALEAWVHGHYPLQSVFLELHTNPLMCTTPTLTFLDLHRRVHEAFAVVRDSIVTTDPHYHYLESLLYYTHHSPSVLHDLATNLTVAPPQPKRQKVHLLDSRIQQLLHDAANLQQRSHQSDRFDVSYAAIDSAEQTDIDRLLNDYATHLAHNPHLAWKCAFANTTKPLPSNASVDVPKFETHFKHVYTTPDAPKVQLPHQPPVLLPNDWGAISDFTMDELQCALRAASRRKALGPDLIPSEVLSCDQVVPDLLILCNMFLHGTKIDDILLSTFIVPLFKKGDKSLPTNYRGISLMPHFSKLIDRLLLDRLRKLIETRLQHNQNAYRPGRSTIQHVIALSHLLSNAKNYQDSPLYVLFVDFSKAFDMVNRHALRSILEWWAVPDCYLTMIFTLLDGQKMFIKSNGVTGTEPLSTSRGVLQGDTLAPFLFDMCMDYIFRDINANHLHLGAVLGTDTPSQATRTRNVAPPVLAPRLVSLGYADDVSLLSNDPVSIQLLAHRFEHLAHSLGFSLNIGIDKTALMCVGAPPVHIHTLDGTPIPLCDKYKYLGVSFHTADQDWRADFNRRKGLAWVAIRKHKDLWRSSASIATKTNLMNALVTPILTYAATTYPTTKTVTMLLHRTHSRMLRHCTNTIVDFEALQSAQSDHTFTEMLYASSLTLPSIVVRDALNALGHWIRDTLLRHNVHPCVLTFAWSPSIVDCHTTKRLHRGHRFHNSHREFMLRHLRIPFDQPQSALDLALERAQWRAASRRAVIATETTVFTEVITRRIADARRPFDSDHRENSIQSAVHHALRRFPLQLVPYESINEAVVPPPMFETTVAAPD